MKSNQLKIIHVIYSLSSGGAERVVLNLCNEQIKEHQVTLLTILKESKETTFYKNQLDPNVQYFNLKSSKGLTIKNFLTVYRCLRKQKPDIVHFHLNTVVYGFIIAFTRKIKLVHTLHNEAELSLGFKGQKWINKWMYKSNRITPVVLSEECAKTFIEQYGIKNIKSVLNGVPQNVPKKLNNASSIFINHLKNEPSNLVFIHVARYNTTQKNQELLFEVFQEIIAKNKHIHLVILGRDYPNYQFPNIHILGEISNPLCYVEHADAMVLSSLTEGIPMSVLEAFSCGVPIVSTPAGGMVDLLKNPQLGILSKDFSKNAFMLSVYEMTLKLQSGYYNKHEIIQAFNKNFSVQQCSDEYLKIYQS